MSAFPCGKSASFMSGILFAALLAAAGFVSAGCTPVEEDDDGEAEVIGSIVVDPEDTVAERTPAGLYEDITFSAEVIPISGVKLSANDQKVTWAIMEKDTAKGTAIDPDTGVLTIDPDETSSSLTVKATSVKSVTKWGTATVTVSGFEFEVSADGDAENRTTTLTLTFNREMWTLTESNITLELPAGQKVTMGAAVTRNFTVFTMTIGGFTSGGTLTVTVTMDGCTVTRTVLIYGDEEPASDPEDPETYTVTLDADGGSGGTPAVTATLGSPMPVPTALPAKNGYSFGGYFLLQGGIGPQYYNYDGTSAKNWNISEDTTLYAKWTEDSDGPTEPEPGISSYPVTLDPDNGSGTEDIFAVYGSPMPEPITLPEKTGYIFGGYWTQKDGLGVKYYNADGTSARNWDIAEDYYTLYAKWTGITYTIVYDGNGHTGGSAPGNQTKTYGRPLNLRTNSGGLERTGYVFDGWNTEAGGTGDDYAAGANLTGDLSDTAGASVPLWAKWTPDPNQCITYKSTEGGETYGTSTEWVLPDASADAASGGLGVPYPSGQIAFKGWTTKPNRKGGYRAAGETYQRSAGESGPVTLYAVWSGDGSSEAKSIAITNLEELMAITDTGGSSPTKYYILAADIGPGADTRPATGSAGPGPIALYPDFLLFDGNGHTIDLNITETITYYGTSHYAGLFGYCGINSYGEIKNLRLTGQVNINMGAEIPRNTVIYAGALAGVVLTMSPSPAIHDVVSEADVRVTGTPAAAEAEGVPFRFVKEVYAGGLAGRVWSGTVSSVVVTGDVETNIPAALWYTSNMGVSMPAVADGAAGSQFAPLTFAGGVTGKAASDNVSRMVSTILNPGKVEKAASLSGLVTGVDLSVYEPVRAAGNWPLVPADPAAHPFARRVGNPAVILENRLDPGYISGRFATTRAWSGTLVDGAASPSDVDDTGYGAGLANTAFDETLWFTTLGFSRDVWEWDPANTVTNSRGVTFTVPRLK